MCRFFKFLSLKSTVLTKYLFLVTLTCYIQSVSAQSGITAIDTTHATPTTTLVTQNASDQAINELVKEFPYDLYYGERFDANVSSYTIGGTTYNNFLTPDTVALLRTDGKRFVNIWYEINTDVDPGNDGSFEVDSISLAPSKVEDADLIYKLRSVNAGYDNILVNVDDEGLNTIQAQTERVDIIWYTGIVTCEPANAVFPVVERGGNDEVVVAAITSLDAQGNPDGFSDLVAIQDSDWPGAGVSFDNFLILRRQTVGVEPLPLANIGTFIPDPLVQTPPASTFQPAQIVQGVAVSFTDLNISANQTVYGYSIFASDIVQDITASPLTLASGVDLTDITTYPTTTAASVSGLDLVAGVTAAVSSDNCLTPSSGPGGYKAALTTWLKANETADVTTSSEGGEVTDWQDHWIGDHDFTTISASAPTYRSTSSSINFNETVDFNSDNRGLSTPSNEAFDDATFYRNKGINIAFRTDETNTDQEKQVIYEQGDQLRGLIVYLQERASETQYDVYVSSWNRNADGTGAPWNNGTNITTISDSISNNKEYIITLELAGDDSSSGTLTAYKNGVSFGSIAGVGRLYDHNSGIELGRSDGNIQYGDGESSSSNSFKGEISEFIYCNEPSSFLLTQRNRIESYLAVKYGITLNQQSPINYVNSQGSVIFDATNNASIGGYLEYNRNIAGIARDDGSEFVQLKSKSENDASILTVERTTAFTSDNNFLLWGNDGGARDDSETSDKPSTIARRVKKVWRAAETGETGLNNLTFDLSQISVTGSPTASDYSLLIADNSSNGVFTSATIVTGGALDGNDLTFSNVNLENGQYFTIATAFSTCGPGGVALADHLNLWLKADFGPNSTTNGAEVTTWEDRAFSNDATATGVGSESPPTYVENSINFNPSLNFDQSDSETLEGSAGFYSNAYYLVVVPDANTSSSSTVDAVLSFDITTGITNRFGSFFFGNALDQDPSTSAPNEVYGHIEGFFGSPHISYLNDATADYFAADVPNYFEVMENDATTPTAYTLAQNGTSSTVTSSGGFLDAENQEYSLASLENQGDFGDAFYFDGKIAEVISYNEVLTADESNRIESYLSIKYGITRSAGSLNYLNSSSATIWNATDNSSHNNDIAGIGRDDDSCLDQKQSKSVNSDAIVTIGLEDIASTNAANSNSFTADESFLVWGNDNAAAIYGNGVDNGDGADITDVSGIGTVTKRMTRIWRVDETGTVGNTEISFDLTGLGYPSTNATDYQLIISQNSDLSSATTTGGGSFEGNVITFDGIDFADGDYFTLGIERTSCGPGGVTADLSLWLKADQGTGSTTNGAEINTWNDQSSSASNLSEDNLGGASPTNPTYTESDINFNPSIEFTSPGGTNGAFMSNTSNSVSGNLSMIAVFRTGQAGGSDSDFEQAPTIIGAGENTTTTDYGLGISEGRVHMNADNNSSLNARSPDGTTYNDLEPYVLTGTRGQSANGTVQLYVNSANVASGSSSATALSSPAGFAIGNLGPSSGSDATQNGQFNGQIAEAIVYADSITPTERQQIESYLAVKYGITRNATDDVSTPSTDERDYFASDGGEIWDFSVTAFNSDIAGIGRDDGSCLNQIKSKSENDDALVTMEIGSFSADDSWLLWGNDNADLYKIRNFERPESINSRLNREWYVQEAGTVGTVTLSFDLSLIEGPTGVGTNNLNQVRLLLDDDGQGTPDSDFSAGVTIIAPTTIDSENDIITFDVDFADGEYFTLGSFENDALPVELIDFNVQEVQGEVLLNWVTASEENNAFYSVERSLDGVNYEVLSNLDGAGTTSEIQNYQYWDTNPQIGFNFYRIKQTDIDGSFSYSPVKSALVEDKTKLRLSVSPNPVSNNEVLKVNWQLPQNTRGQILYLIDIHGRVIVKQALSTNDREKEIPIDQLQKGLYILRIRTEGSRSIAQKVIIK